LGKVIAFDLLALVCMTITSAIINQVEKVPEEIDNYINKE